MTNKHLLRIDDEGHHHFDKQICCIYPKINYHSLKHLHIFGHKQEQHLKNNQSRIENSLELGAIFTYFWESVGAPKLTPEIDTFRSNSNEVVLEYFEGTNLTHVE